MYLQYLLHTTTHAHTCVHTPTNIQITDGCPAVCNVSAKHLLEVGPASEIVNVPPETIFHSLPLNVSFRASPTTHVNSDTLTGAFSLSSFSSWEKRSRHSFRETPPAVLLLGMGSDRSQKTSNVVE